MWGAAEFVGLPPWWLVREGFLAGCLGAGTIVGVTVVLAERGRVESVVVTSVEADREQSPAAAVISARWPTAMVNR